MMKCARTLVVILICLGIMLLGPGSGWVQEPEPGQLPIEPEEVAARFVEALTHLPNFEEEVCYQLISERERSEFPRAYVECMVGDLYLYMRQPKCAAQIDESSEEEANAVVTTAWPTLPVKLVRELVRGTGRRRPHREWRVDLLKTWTATTGKSEEWLGNLDEQFSPHSMADLKQLCLAAQMYASDWDSYLPPADKWCDTLYPYVQNEGIFHCPAVPLDEYGYAFNKNLDGISLEDIQFPTQTVVFFESTLGTRNATGTGESLPDPPRYPEGNIFGFADGHVQQIKYPETFVIWKP